MTSNSFRTIAERKPATPSTRKINEELLNRLPFDSTREYDDAHRGLVEEVKELEIVNGNGEIVWSMKDYAFMKEYSNAPDSANPSYWRHENLNAISGLFKVSEKIYQVRGFDGSNMTLVIGNSGYIVIDTLSCAETAKAAFELAQKHLGHRKISAIIITHSHLDHFGGARGLVTDEDVASGKVQIIAPAGFMEATVSENVFLGLPMLRRATYQFGTTLPKGPLGQLGCGLGKGLPAGAMGLIPPTRSVTATREQMVVDGVEIIFQMTPEAEAPAEMCFYLPQMKALCMAEIVSFNIHNMLPFRGAKARSAKAWAHHIHEAMELFGEEAEVLFLGHHWPCWGNGAIRNFMTKQRDMYKYTHDQTIRLMNHGLTMLEIAESLSLPESLDKEWFNRGYYGTLSHNIKATYQFYMGWFDANPAALNALPPVEAGRKYVEFMGGQSQVIANARRCFEDGEYRWVAQVMSHVVFAYPENGEARELEADALEQLGYQSESATWRNLYLTGAMELRDYGGNARQAMHSPESTVVAMPTESLFDYISIRLNGQLAAGKAMVLNFFFIDTHETWSLTLGNAVLNCWPRLMDEGDAMYVLKRSHLNEMLLKKATVAVLVATGEIEVRGDGGKLDELFSLLDDFKSWFNIVLP